MPVGNGGPFDGEQRHVRESEIQNGLDNADDGKRKKFPPFRKQKLHGFPVLARFVYVLFHGGVTVLDELDLAQKADELDNHLFSQPREKGYEHHDDGNEEIKRHGDDRDRKHDVAAPTAAPAVEPVIVSDEDEQDDRNQTENDRGNDKAHERDCRCDPCGDIVFLVKVVDLEGLSARAERSNTVVISAEEHRLDRIAQTEFSGGDF